jgi:uncharacterized protein YbaR (Trm112 family)
MTPDGTTDQTVPDRLGFDDSAPGDTARTDTTMSGGHGFDRRMLEALVCPVTRAPLSYDAQAQELISTAAHLAFPIRAGIPVMLVSEAREIV